MVIDPDKCMYYTYLEDEKNYKIRLLSVIHYCSLPIASAWILPGFYQCHVVYDVCIFGKMTLCVKFDVSEGAVNEGK